MPEKGACARRVVLGKAAQAQKQVEVAFRRAKSSLRTLRPRRLKVFANRRLTMQAGNIPTVNNRWKSCVGNGLTGSRGNANVVRFHSTSFEDRDIAGVGAGFAPFPPSASEAAGKPPGQKAHRLGGKRFGL